jgi:hypothetical protein
LVTESTFVSSDFRINLPPTLARTKYFVGFLLPRLLMGVMGHESDGRLLQKYAWSEDQGSFAEIVARHTNLVFSAAYRKWIHGFCGEQPFKF